MRRPGHGLIKYKDAKTKCRHLKKKLTCKGILRQVYSQLCWYYRPSFVNCCPSNLLSGSNLPLSPSSLCVPVSLWHYAVYTCGTGPCCGWLVSCVDVALCCLYLWYWSMLWLSRLLCRCGTVLFIPVVLVHVVVVSSLVSMWHCAVSTCGTGPCCGCLISCVDVALCCLYLWYWSILWLSRLLCGCGTVLFIPVVLVHVVVVSSLVSMCHCAVYTCGTGPCCGCLVTFVSMWHCAVCTCGTGPCCGCLLSCVDVALCCLYLWYWSMLWLSNLLCRWGTP